jgi:hypothetical protein
MDTKGHRIVWSVLVVLCLGALAWWWTGRGERNALAPAAPVASTPAAPVLDLPAAGLEPVAAHAAEPAREAPEPREVAPVATAPAATSLAEIRGRLVFADGSPAAAVSCSVHGWGGNQERVLRHGKPADWQDPSGTTDADGRFSIRFDPPRAFQFTLQAKQTGFAGVAWRWGEIAPGAVVDVGEVVLLAGATLEGRIVDREGNALGEQGWTVFARSAGLRERNGRDETQVLAHVHPGSARFRLEDVMPGRVELRVDSDMADFSGPPVTLAAGETRTLDLVYEGPDNSRRITLSTSSTPFHVMSSPDAEHVQLHGPGAEVRTATRPGSGDIAFEDLPDGAYTITIDDPRYLPWTSPALHPGQNARAKLEGSSALALRVLDEHGEPLEAFELRVEFRNVNFRPTQFAVAHERGLVRGMFAGDYTVHVTAGERQGAAEIDGLLAGETRALTLALGEACTVSGSVVYRDGPPAAGLEVLLLRPAEVDDSPDSPVLTHNMFSSNAEYLRKEIDSAVSDASGHFRFVVPRAGAYVVHATQDGSSVSSDVLELSGDGREGIELVLPRGGRLRGRLLADGEVSWAGFRVSFQPAPGKGDSLAPRFAGDSICLLEADGRFELGPVPAGSGVVRLQLPEERSSAAGAMSSPSSGQELGTVTIEEGAVLERDFEVRDLPGMLVLVVRVNGVPTAGLRVQLSSSVARLSVETDAQGTYGPRATFATTWNARVEDRTAGWSWADRPRRCEHRCDPRRA